MAEKILNKEEFDKIIRIINSELSDSDKALELGNMIYFTDLKKMFDDQIRYKEMLKSYDKSSLELIINTFTEYDFKKLFNQVKKSYKCDVKELNFRLDIINKIYEALRNGSTDLEISELVFSNFKDSLEFQKKYVMLLKFGSNDLRLEVAREALNNFDFILEGINSLPIITVENAIYKREMLTFLELNGYIDNYLYAEFVIKMFIESDFLDISSYLTKMRIDATTHKYCEEIISIINPMLFNKYQESISLKEKEFLIKNISSIEKLDLAIQTGYLDFDKEFELLDFFILLPFKETGVNLKKNLSKFISENFENGDSIYRNICAFMHKNNIISFLPIKESNIFSVATFIDNQIIDDSTKKAVLKYMESNNLPMINNVYKIILNKYVKGLLDDLSECLVDIDNQYNNPYVLKKVINAQKK